MHVDPNGKSFKELWENIKNGFNNLCEWLDKYALNDDGTYSLYDNDRFKDENSWHEQILSASGSNPNLDLKEGNVVLWSVGLDLYTGGWEGKYVDFSLIDIGHAETAAEFNDGNLNLSAFASAWSPSFSLNVFGVKIEIGAEIGSIGASLDVGTKKISAKGAYGWGLALSVEW